MSPLGVAPKGLPGFWLFQLPWVPIIHFMWNPLLIVPPHYLVYFFSLSQSDNITSINFCWNLSIIIIWGFFLCTNLNNFSVFFKLIFWLSSANNSWKVLKKLLKLRIMQNTVLIMKWCDFWHSFGTVNPNWHEAGHFYPLVILGLDFVSWICIRNFQTILEVKMTSIDTLPSSLSLIKLTPRWH